MLPLGSEPALNELLLRKEEEWRALQAHRTQLQEAYLVWLFLMLFYYHSDKKGEIDHHREQYENLKWTLERKLEELDGELALQRQELLLEFESKMRKREHEFRLQADNMSNTALSRELKVKLLHKELEALKEAGAKAAESLQRAEATNAELERKLQSRAGELRDLEAVSRARVKDLEDKLHSVQLTRKKEEETFKRKHEELDRLAREKDAVLVAVKGAHVEQLQELQARVLELQAHCETLEAQLRRAEWRQADTAKEKDGAIDQLREDASTVKSAWDAQIAQLSKEMVSKDLQIQTLQEEEVKLKVQVARSQQDIERYKQQLSLAVERERSLERDQVQLGLDWQRRCDDIERDQIQKSEALIQGLTTAKSQVAAKLQETEQALREQEVVLKAVTLERDQAMQALRIHGLPGPGAQMLLRQHEEEISKDFPSSEIQRLREQNMSLRNAIAQMRKEMEALSHQIPPPVQTAAESTDANQPDPEAGGDAATPDYVLALEAEIRTLKHKFKTLEKHLEDTLDPLKMSSPHAESQPSVRTSTETTGEYASHWATWSVQAGQAGGSVQAGPVSSGLALRKLGDRVQLLNLLVTQLRQKVLREPLELAALQHELPREVDQVHLEILELRKQVAELGKHLRIAQHGGAEPSGRKQPPASDAVALGREDAKSAKDECPSRHLGKHRPRSAQVGSRLDALQGPKTQHSIHTVTCKSPQQQEDRSPKPPQAPERPEERRRQSHSSSSFSSGALQDTWRLLDLGSSPSGLTSQGDSTPELPAPPAAHRSPVKMQAGVATPGMKTAAQAKAKPTGASRSHPAKAKSCQRPPKIRNNIMD
uniref:Coiled-coil domain containing 57 n=1 Tax=Nomascus leucogenys TaxID=61853 RepID=G1RUZ8_NOMLE